MKLVKAKFSFRKKKFNEIFCIIVSLIGTSGQALPQREILTTNFMKVAQNILIAIALQFGLI